MMYMYKLHIKKDIKNRSFDKFIAIYVRYVFNKKSLTTKIAIFQMQITQ